MKGEIGLKHIAAFGALKKVGLTHKLQPKQHYRVMLFFPSYIVVPINASNPKEAIRSAQVQMANASSALWKVAMKHAPAWRFIRFENSDIDVAPSKEELAKMMQELQAKIELLNRDLTLINKLPQIINQFYELIAREEKTIQKTINDKHLVEMQLRLQRLGGMLWQLIHQIEEDRQFKKSAAHASGQFKCK